ncbi:PTS lactose/cellobiose transporter subunit IIA [Desmospora activa]|uniref:PTS system lichenan oligosaccharide-specific IIA component (Lac family) n=1 Tax=Desmospora activa DSM 45169 TaxID=1121389 RepID=A0A2T4Z7D8_9BACL|nr:PTS lactose/cellobiose transporter subunit IIA [Desmospora activa]PTM57793.1 PTS system lichenan oligosaccharide-specific IIA component (Lac family) [Desmospora activa DSM 45169]
MEEITLQIIVHGGNGRSFAMEAIGAAKEGRFTEAREKLVQAVEELHKAHQYQTSLIQEEINGGKSDISLLMIHAQDHLMNAITMKDLANEIVELHESLQSSKG